MRFYGVQLSLDSDLAMDLNLFDSFTRRGLAITEEGFSITAPEVRTNYLDVLGLDGVLDASDSPQGYPVYKNRTLKFNLFRPRSLFRPSDMADLEAVRTVLMNDWQGVRCRIILPTDDTHYYLGRLSFGDLDSSSGFIPCTADVYPYKLAKAVTEKTITGLTTDWQEFELENDRRFCIPQVTVNRPTVIQVLAGAGGIPDEVTLTPSGTQTFTHPDLLLVSGTVPVQAKLLTSASSSYLHFSYREGCF